MPTLGHHTTGCLERYRKEFEAGYTTRTKKSHVFQPKYKQNRKDRTHPPTSVLIRVVHSAKYCSSNPLRTGGYHRLAKKMKTSAVAPA